MYVYRNFYGGWDNEYKSNPILEFVRNMMISGAWNLNNLLFINRDKDRNIDIKRDKDGARITKFSLR